MPKLRGECFHGRSTDEEQMCCEWLRYRRLIFMSATLPSPVVADAVRRLPDPVPADGRKVPGGWWPPVMLEPGWVTDHHDRFDVFHVHFGFDAITPEDLRKVVEELEQHDKPLVYTVHDLRNPHHSEPTAHDKQQDVLVAAADTLITLTHGAARAVSERWGRNAVVLPHPHVLD